jgi:RNA polymerase sigma-70 factor (ECF subfamily)
MRDSTTSSTDGLVRSFRQGDPAAADELARRALRSALRTCAAITRNREEAADIAQDVTVEVLRSLPRLRDPAAFDAWVHRITVRHTIRAVGTSRSRRRSETSFADLSAEPVAPPGPDRELALALREPLAAALAALPLKQRLALALRYVHDLDDAEIADALDCRPGTVHALLSRGRSALRRDPRLALAMTTVGG